MNMKNTLKFPRFKKAALFGNLAVETSNLYRERFNFLAFIVYDTKFNLCNLLLLNSSHHTHTRKFLPFSDIFTNKSYKTKHQYKPHISL